MMNAQEYRKRTRKTITCPSGLELQIRKIKSIDYLKLGILPDTLNNIETDPQKVDPAMVEKLQKMFVLRGVVPNKEIRIVDKPLDQLADNEIAYDDLEDEDLNCIISEVSKFSKGEKMKGGDNIEPFHKEPVS